ncbi:MAG TPA: rhodanese-like domain-containing protein [Thermoanaerobaculia bacterium]|nr:rhodanese-like domain-containing protein [Thermoanaerobaculia bacterium]
MTVLARLMGLRTISPRDLSRELEERRTAVFDVNGPGSWERAHVPGARRLDPAAFEPSDLPAERSAALVFYCSNPLCRKAPNAARRARGFGYENVRVMSAGIQGWIGAGLPVESVARQ